MLNIKTNKKGQQLLLAMLGSATVQGEEAATIYLEVLAAIKNATPDATPEEQGQQEIKKG